MNEIKEILHSQLCHIHHQRAEIAVLPNEKLVVKTCCILFKEQLNLLALKDGKETYLEEL
ncbi:hypothetical protein [Segetibacter aerophilus]|uniref:Uncharacterized protein n=1 Tax=Segetibacter aerophilus TaxID=670293 RepID=A0A512BJE9_9BACT|nr:hypothetical protein [Segetibacter aerophilus]GEO12092.1 hypothetical protein SAE01_45880 [Segetibacter aerophilus]